ncbi:cell division protein SepF [Cyanobacterium aponinum UTEX 3222]|uniref:Cell division protein SepF n=3 Tax=Cyanobacterium aponinum TaxID=379064 RepID=K9Z5F2_CYAAP|nr:cell division protein SepF [Cyanobacterium aponinum]MTF38992.1 DUF552 domain-containing protein [Cyanobacterium aponinum 0216]PHV62435.1 DUF552 domain-containing protein [Cyanobacterium aponinum IPPAS B-1201]WRL41471.1 cell division protein SepF [Cyanobacterium aponinum UTEX 3222]AFZ53628.1 Cell division protein sepF [Cyanobacterium aponinum PCC 10605]WPF89695.1 cell division protein SepF [Cyanobacterium aponinum AL20115]
MSNFLGKLKDIIGGGQGDYQYYEEEIESMTTQDLPPSDIEMNEVAIPQTEAPVTPPLSSSRRRPRDNRETSAHKSSDVSSSYLDSGNFSSNLPNNVIGMPGVNNIVNEVVVIEPHSFDEIPQVIQTLKEQRSVILNLNVMEAEEAQRAVDFVAGGTYAIDGHQERIGESIFLFTPRNVKVSTISGKSYQNGNTKIGSEGLTKSFDALWNETSSTELTDSMAQ